MVGVDYRAAVRRRALLRWTLRLVLLSILGMIIGDRLGWFGYRGDDWGRFDHRGAVIRAVGSDGSVQISGDKGEATVRLLGIELGDGTVAFLNGFVGRRVIVRLEPLQARDEEGRVRAYLYLTDEQVLNVDVVREGWAKADRMAKHSLAALVDAAETEAKKRRRGIWRVAATTRASTTRASR